MAARRAIAAGALRATVALPRTGFPMRAQAAAREPAQVDRLTSALYARQLAAAARRRRGARDWVLHDGPPYANGALHMGHFLNKVLKDIVNRRALLQGRRVAFVPGWDCHGLPIELKVLAELRERQRGSGGGGGAPPPRLSPLELRRLAAASATEAIAGQAADFRRWGVLADWDGVQRWVAAARRVIAAGGAAPLPSPAAAPPSVGGVGGDGGDGLAASPPPLYVTMTPAYEAAQLQLWGAMVAAGRVTRALKPVHWSPSSRTALAEAELEYADAHVSASVFVAFPLVSAAWAADRALAAALHPMSLDARGSRRCSSSSSSSDSSGAYDGAPPPPPLLEAAVWTTTPWTLPANVALAVSAADSIRYSVVAVVAATGASGDSGSGASGSAAVPTGGGLLRRHFLVATDRVDELRRVLAAATAANQQQQQQRPAVELSEVLGGLRGSQLRGLLFAHPFLESGDAPAVAATTQAGELWCVPASHGGEAAAHLCAPALAVIPADGAPPPAGGVRVSPVITGPAVTADSGTGVVHTAPGHGGDDFDACAGAREALARQLQLPADGPPAAAGTLSVLPVLCPVDDDGKFTLAAGPVLAGQHVLKDGQASVLALLQRCGSLLLSEPFTHRYPYDWRSKQPVIVRATQQWFVRLTDGCSAAPQRSDAGSPSSGSAGGAAAAPRDDGDVLSRATAALEGVAFTPRGGRARLIGTLGTRREWCVSRQRAWGVPIPAVYVVGGADGAVAVVADDDGGRPVELRRGDAYMTPASIRHVAGLVAAGGADAWWALPVEQLVPARVHAAVTAAGLSLAKGTDTLDVWFDSGVSWAASWGGYDDEAPAFDDGGHSTASGTPAAPSHRRVGGRRSDMVLEGSDQHRGWFQSALLTAAAASQGGGGRAAAPYAAVVTHGFVLDEKLRKMSKSLGNVIAPSDIIDGKAAGGGGGGGAKPEGLGVDVLRLWAASADYTRDLAIGPGVLATVTEAARKLRNTARFLLASLHQSRLPHSAGDGGAPSPPSSHASTEAAATLAPGAAHSTAEEAAMLAAWSAPVFLGERERLPESLPLLESLLLHRLAVLQGEVEGGYSSLSLQRVSAALANTASFELSSVYFDAVKDALYCDPPEQAAAPLHVAAPGAASCGAQPAARLSRQAASRVVLWEALRVLVRALAPIMPFTAEEVFQHSAEFILPGRVVGPMAAGPSASPVAVARVCGVTVFDASIPLLPAEWGVQYDSCSISSGGCGSSGSSSGSSSSSSSISGGGGGGGDGGTLSASAAGASSACASVTLPHVPLAVPASVAWEALTWLRAEANRALEAARQGRDIGASTEAQLDVHFLDAGSTPTGPAAPVDHAASCEPLRLSSVAVLRGVLARLLHEGAASDVLLASQVTVHDIGGRVVSGACSTAGGVVRIAAAGAGGAPGGWAYVSEAPLPSFGLPSALQPVASASAVVRIEVTAAAGGRCVRCRRHAPEVAMEPPRGVSGDGSNAAAEPPAQPTGATGVAGKSAGKRKHSSPSPVATAAGGHSDALGSLPGDAAVIACTSICGRCQRALDASNAWPQAFPRDV